MNISLVSWKTLPLFRLSFVLINAGQSKGEEIIFQPFVLTWLISGTEWKQHIVYHSSDTPLFLSYCFCSTCLHALCVLSSISTVKDWPRTFYSGQRSKTREHSQSPHFCYITWHKLSFQCATFKTDMNAQNTLCSGVWYCWSGVYWDLMQSFQVDIYGLQYSWSTLLYGLSGILMHLVVYLE